MAEASPAVVEIEEVVEGEYAGTADLLFYRIGASVPLRSSEHTFDTKDAPKQPLAVSERFGVLFVAYLEGFLVVSTKDVIRLAKEIKETVDEEMNKGIKGKGRRPSVQESSILDVPLGKISILALSADSSILAACTGDTIYLFSVPSVIRKKQEPFVSCFLGKFGRIKDLQWCKSHNKTYVALSSSGALLCGDLDGKLQEIMHNIDAVDWSVDGSSLAVGSSETLRILSSQFDEQIQLPLLQSWTIASDPETHMKVDSIKWMRNGIIIIGCIQLNNNNDEDGYFVQVINSGDDGFKKSSKPVAISFFDFFHAMGDNFTPFEWGPQIFASFLDRWRIAVLANRRNMDDHVMLLEFPDDNGSKNVVGLEIEQEKFMPRIELQENRDENLILGLGVDKVSLYEHLQFVNGEDVKELSPYCILLCLTIEGKVVMFHVARVSDPCSALVQPSFEVPEEVVLTEKVPMTTVPSQSLESALKLANGEQPVALQTVDRESNASLATEMSVGKPPVLEQPLGSTSKQEFSMPFGHSQPSQSYVMNSVRNNDITNLPPSKPSLGVAQKIEIPGLLSDHLHSAANATSLPSSIKGTNMHPSDSQGMKNAAVAGGVKSLSLTAEVNPFLESHLSTTRQLNPSVYRPHKSPVPELDLSRPLYSVNDMVKELDKLLLGIEQDGGPDDASMSSLKNSVLALEKGLEDLLLKSVAAKASIGEVVTQIQHLNDTTVQISAREGYMKGIVKQASNSQYWDIWNRQKLGPDFELKQEQILKANQNLRNQLIDLERHFNILEFNKFGESSGTYRHRGAVTPPESSRRIQNFHRLHNTVTSQLSAAEHLSECLSKQMSALNIASPPMKQQTTARGLLESIGVHLDSFESPDMKKATLPFASSTNGIMSSASCTSKDGRSKATEYRGFEPETARRRRDSLDRSLVRFEPQKTTVKRTIQQVGHKVDSRKLNGQWSLERFSYDEKNKEQHTSASLLHSTPDNSQFKTTQFWEKLGNDANLVQQDSGLQDDMYKRSGGLSKYTESGISRFSQIQTAQTSPLLPSAFTSTARFNSISNRTYENNNFPEKMASRSVRMMDHSSSYESIVSENNEGTHNMLDEMSANFATSSTVSGYVSPAKSPTLETSMGKGQSSQTGQHILASSPVASINISQVANPPMSAAVNSSFFEMDRKLGMSQTVETTAFSQSSTSFSTLSPVKPSVSSPVSIFSSTVATKASSSSSIISTGHSPDKVKFGLDVKQTPPMSMASTSSAAFQSLPPSRPSSFQFESTQLSSSFSTLGATSAQTSQLSSSSLVSTSPSLSSTSPSQSKGSQSLASFSSGASAISAGSVLSSTSSVSTSRFLSSASSFMLSKDPQSSPSLSSSTFTFSQSLSLSSTLSSSSSVVIPSPNSTLNGMNEMTAKNQNDLPGATGCVFPHLVTAMPASSSSAISSSTLAKNDALDLADIPEDDMEEEAPESTSTLNLGSLGGFSLGSSSATSAQKSNPFGGSFVPTVSSPASSPFSGSTPSGQLFKPASFSLPSAQQTQSSSPMNPTGGSSGFSGFGQPPQIGSGQQALGSVLGAFGQSRQFGNSALPGGLSSGGFGGSAGGFSTAPKIGAGFSGTATGGGFAAVASGTGGFTSAATGGGFASLASGTGGGFASLASGTGGFASASTGGGFAAVSSGTSGFATPGGGGGFAAVASMGGTAGGFATAALGLGFAGAAGGSGFAGAGGFGAVGSGGFGAAAGSTGASKPPPQLLMQMRK